MSELRVGTFYGIGVGPGDPELLTLKALRLIQTLPILFVPVARAGAPSYARTIAQTHLDSRQQPIVDLVFAMHEEPERMAARWMVNAEKIAASLGAGHDAGFLTEGDPSTYSTFVHVSGALHAIRPDVPVVVVPGISSPQAAAARLQLPLADRAERLVILPASYERDDLRSILTTFDTVVLLKVAPVIDALVDLLEDLDLVERAAFVSRVGRPDEVCVRDVRSLRGQQLDYFSLLIVRRMR